MNLNCCISQGTIVPDTTEPSTACWKFEASLRQLSVSSRDVRLGWSHLFLEQPRIFSRTALYTKWAFRFSRHCNTGTIDPCKIKYQSVVKEKWNISVLFEQSSSISFISHNTPPPMLVPCIKLSTTFTIHKKSNWSKY
jgi:hypothetical protein